MICLFGDISDAESYCTWTLLNVGLRTWLMLSAKHEQVLFMLFCANTFVHVEKCLCTILKNQGKCLMLTRECSMSWFIFQSGFTPLHIASHYGNTNVSNLLIQRGADVNYKAKVF